MHTSYYTWYNYIKSILTGIFFCILVSENRILSSAVESELQGTTDSEIIAIYKKIHKISERSCVTILNSNIDMVSLLLDDKNSKQTFIFGPVNHISGFLHTKRNNGKRSIYSFFYTPLFSEDIQKKINESANEQDTIATETYMKLFFPIKWCLLNKKTEQYEIDTASIIGSESYSEDDIKALLNTNVNKISINPHHVQEDWKIRKSLYGIGTTISPDTDKVIDYTI